MDISFDFNKNSYSAKTVFVSEDFIIGKKYYLSISGYYFIYRTDKYDKEVTRAELFRKDKSVVENLRVSAGYGLKQKTHFGVINWFEYLAQIDALVNG